MMTLEIAKENLFKGKKLNYLEALQSKLELIRNQDVLEVDVENIKIEKIENSYYLKYQDLEVEILIVREER